MKNMGGAYDAHSWLKKCFAFFNFGSKKKEPTKNVVLGKHCSFFHCEAKQKIGPFFGFSFF